MVRSHPFLTSSVVWQCFGNVHFFPPRLFCRRLFFSPPRRVFPHACSQHPGYGTGWCELRSEQQQQQQQDAEQDEEEQDEGEEATAEEDDVKTDEGKRCEL